MARLELVVDEEVLTVVAGPVFRLRASVVTQPYSADEPSGFSLSAWA